MDSGCKVTVYLSIGQLFGTLFTFVSPILALLPYICLNFAAEMRKPYNRRLRAAWLLLVIYAAMVLAVSVHRHEDVGQDSVACCQDCARHVKHAGHFSVDLPVHGACVLCQLQAMPCLVPTVLAGVVFAVAVTALPRMVCRVDRLSVRGLVSLRAPPCMTAGFYGR